MSSKLILKFAVMLAMATATCPAVAEPGSEQPGQPPSSLGTRLLAATQVILDNHIDPPVRQQLVLQAAKALHRATGKPVPRKLSEEISALASPKQMAAYLDGVETGSPTSAAEIETHCMAAMLAVVPGGANVTSALEVKVQGQLSANQYVGTGIALGMKAKEGRPTMTKVFFDGPAWKAGARDGELILAIDGEDTKPLSLKQVVDRLRGEAGSEVEVVLRQGDQEPRTVKITRGVTFIPTVAGYRQVSPSEWRYEVDGTPHVAYVRIDRIGSSTLAELRQVERRLHGKPVKSLIIDLRFGGGSLHDTVLIADGLLEDGKIGQIRFVDSVKKYTAKPGRLFRELQVVVLVDQATQADRQFLAAALQDNDRAIVVGEPTAGQGYVRRAVPVPGGDLAIVMPTGILHRGDGTPLLANRSGVNLRAMREWDSQPPRNKSPRAKHAPGGIVPDHLVRPTSSQRELLRSAYAYTSPGLKKPADDPLLAKAIEVLTADRRADLSPARSSS